MPTTESRPLRHLRNDRGVTLVESLVALTLLALGTAAVGDFMVSQIRHASSNHLTTQAYAHAADELERIRALPYGAMRGDSHEIDLGGIAFTVTSTVTDGVPSANMKSVDVTVNWAAPGGSESIDVHSVYTQVSDR